MALLVRKSKIKSKETHRIYNVTTVRVQWGRYSGAQNLATSNGFINTYYFKY